MDTVIIGFEPETEIVEDEGKTEVFFLVPAKVRMSQKEFVEFRLKVHDGSTTEKRD